MKSDVNFEGEHRLNNKEESKNDIEVLQFQQSQINPDGIIVNSFKIFNFWNISEYVYIKKRSWKYNW